MTTTALKIQYQDKETAKTFFSYRHDIQLVWNKETKTWEALADKETVKAAIESMTPAYGKKIYEAAQKWLVA